MASSVVEELIQTLQSEKPKDGYIKLKILLDEPSFCSYLDGGAENEPHSWSSLLLLVCQIFEKKTKNQRKSDGKKSAKPKADHANVLHKLLKKSLGHEKSFFLVEKIGEIYEQLYYIIRRAPEHRDEYCSILADLLESQYRFYLPQELYTELVTFLIDQSSYVNLVPVLSFSPGYLPETMREKVASCLKSVLTNYSVGKISLRKLLRAVIELLKRDGHSLGSHLREVHSGAKSLFNSWSSMSGSEQDLLVLYLTIQLKLKTVFEGEDGQKDLENLLNFAVERVLSSGDNLKCSLLPALRLSSRVIFEALTRCKNYSVHDAKRRKKENLPVLLNEHLNSSDFLWTGTFCFLVRDYHHLLPVEFLSEKLQILFNRLESSSESVWTIRCLTELCKTMTFSSNDSNVWQCVWNAVLGRLPSISDPALVLEEFKVLGFLLRKNRLNACVVPDNFWELPYFTQSPESGPLFFASSLSTYASYELRRTLLVWALSALNTKALLNIPPKLLSAVFLALSVSSEAEACDILPCWSNSVKDQEAELEKLDAMEEVVPAPSCESKVRPRRKNVFLSKGQSRDLLGALIDNLQRSIQQILSSRPTLETHFSLCAVVSYCFAGMEAHLKASDKGDVVKVLSDLFNSATSLVNGPSNCTQANEQLSERAALRLEECVSVFAGRSVAFPADALLKSLKDRSKSMPEEVHLTSSPDFVMHDELDHPNNVESVPNSRLSCISMITSLGKLLPEAAFSSLQELLSSEKSIKVSHELILSMSRCFTAPSLLSKIASLVEVMENAMKAELNADGVCFDVLACLEMILSQLNSHEETLEFLAGELLSKIVAIVEQVEGVVHFLEFRTRVMLGKVISSLGTFDRDLTYPKFTKRLLTLLSDPDFRVRVQSASFLNELFKTCSEHEKLLKDVHSSLSIKLPNSSTDTLDTSKMPASAALIALGEISAASEQVETEAVFTILAVGASQADQRTLAQAVLDKVATRLGYPQRQKYLKQLLGGVLNIWTDLSLPLSRFLEASELWDEDGDFNQLLMLVLPLSLSQHRPSEVEWMAEKLSTSVKDLISTHFPAVYASLTALKLDPNEILPTFGFSTFDMDQHVVVSLSRIIERIILLVSADGLKWPFLSKNEAVDMYRTLTLGRFLKDSLMPIDVFKVLLEVHRLSAGCSHWRHKRHCLAKLETVLDILQDTVRVPGTFRYLLHIILEAIETTQLQSDCCSLISRMIQRLDKSTVWILGEQLQALVSKLVTCIIAAPSPPSSVLELLNKVTVEADGSLTQELKELDQFPDLPCFKHLRDWQSKRFQFDTFSDKFVKFLQRAPYVPTQLRLWSLASFCNQLREIKASARIESAQAAAKCMSSDEAALCVWKLVFFGNEEDDRDARNLSAEILAMAGLQNLALHSPLVNGNFSLPSLSWDVNGDVDMLEVVLKQISMYLIDKDVSIIELASRTAQSLLATSEGKTTFFNFTDHEKVYLEPHYRGLAPSGASSSSSKGNLLVLDDDSIWSISGKTFDAWISTLVYHLIRHLDDPVLLVCRDLALLKASLSEVLFPRVFVSLTKRVKVGSKVYNGIVEQIKTHIFSDRNKNIKAVQVFMHVLNQLRNCYIKALVTEGSQHLQWPKVYWLDLDYLLIARAAERCAAYFSSALYLDYWCEEKHERHTLGVPFIFNERELPEHLESMFSVFAKVNEPDSIHGLATASSPMIQTRLYEHDGKWEEAVKSYDLLLSCSNSDEIYCTRGITRALLRMGMNTLAVKNSGQLSNDKEFQELQFEDAWRWEKWELNSSTEDPAQLGFHGNLHQSLQCLKEGEGDKFQCHVNQMKEELVLYVVDSSLESTQNVHPAIIKLMMVECLSLAWDFCWPSCEPSTPVKPSDDQLQRLLKPWTGMVERKNYNHVEPFGIFLKVLLQAVGRSDRLPNLLVELSRVARKAGRLNQAAKIIQQLNNLSDPQCIEIFSMKGIEEAKVMWAQGHQKEAVTTMQHLLASSTTETLHTITARRVTGKWLAQTRMAHSSEILKSYFQKSVNIAMSHDRFLEQRSRSHYQLARFADGLCQSCEEKLKSSERQEALHARGLQRRRAEGLLERSKSTPDPKDQGVLSARAYGLYLDYYQEETKDKNLQTNSAFYLDICLKSYMACLLTSNTYDVDVVFKLVSLWFKHQNNQQVIDNMLECVVSVPSYKFIPLVHQIVSRLGAFKATNDFQHSLQTLIMRMATEHPYHCIYQILALSKGDLVRGKTAKFLAVNLARKQAAKDVLSKVRGVLGAKLISQMESLREMYILIAEHEIKPAQQQVYLHDLVRAVSVSKFSELPVLTVTLQPNSDYSHVPKIESFDDMIRIMGGVSRPKLITCLGSDGTSYQQLAKAGDDLRQDAVMQQLFALVNSSLLKRPETRKRDLKLRTYNVVPLTPNAGVLEMVQRTTSMAEYLVGRDKLGGAHKRYGGSDWDFTVCEKRMEAADSKVEAADSKAKIDAFGEVCKNFRPVFRNFFREKATHPVDMFEKRMNYTRSVAATSMVGYVVGLGDRHLNNILIDMSTAEVVHIDFGVAFEQEIEPVPFRLTRDIVDGMGVTGVEGVFRRCCEATLAVLQANKEALLTIIEVFLHDPLYLWALSHYKASDNPQQEAEMETEMEVDVELEDTKMEIELEEDEEKEVDDEEEKMEKELNHDAFRALIRVKQKLDGFEAGEICTVPIQGQVEQLIKEAQDPNRLAQMDVGWGPWL